VSTKNKWTLVAHFPKHLKDVNFGRLPLGYQVVLIYIGTESVEINLASIARRVLAGGHNVPEADVRRRYTTSFRNLPEAILAPTM
jgi:predicted ABC-type ATPase